VHRNRLVLFPGFGLLTFIRSIYIDVCRIAIVKAAFNKKRTLLTSTLDLELRKKLVKCYVWSIDLYGAET
jgi:hypothetical protein